MLLRYCAMKINYIGLFFEEFEPWGLKRKRMIFSNFVSLKQIKIQQKQRRKDINERGIMDPSPRVCYTASKYHQNNTFTDYQPIKVKDYL